MELNKDLDIPTYRQFHRQLGADGWLGMGWTVWLLLGVVALTAFLMTRWMRALLGGLTGDTYGATCEVAEMVGLLAFVLLAGRGMLP